MTLEARATDDFTSSTQWKVHDLARMAMNQCDGDPTFAAQKLYEWAMDDSGIYFVLTSHLIWNACKQATAAESRKDRSSILQGASRAEKSKATIKKADENFGGKRLDALLDTLMDCPLPGGKKLRYATAEELYEHANRYFKQAREMERRANWWKLIAAQVGEKPVGEVLTDEQLRDLWARA